MKPAGRAHAPWDEFLFLCFFLSQFIFFLYNIIAEIKTGCRRIIHFIVCSDFWLPCWFLCTDSHMCTRAALTALCACFPDEETPGLYGFLHVIVHSAKGFEQSASKSARNSFFFFFSSNCTCAHTLAQHLLTHSGCAYTCLPAKHMTQSIITAGTCSFHHHMAKMQRKEKSRERERMRLSQRKRWSQSGIPVVVFVKQTSQVTKMLKAHWKGATSKSQTAAFRSGQLAIVIPLVFVHTLCYCLTLHKCFFV